MHSLSCGHLTSKQRMIQNNLTNIKYKTKQRKIITVTILRAYWEKIYCSFQEALYDELCCSYCMLCAFENTWGNAVVGKVEAGTEGCKHCPMLIISVRLFAMIPMDRDSNFPYVLIRNGLSQNVANGYLIPPSFC